MATEINLHAPALLPDDYCGDVHLRLSFYKKLATAKTVDQIDSLLEEIVDRFGKLPPQGQTLIDMHRLRVLAKPYGVVKVDAAPGVIHITFRKDPPIEGMAIMHLIQKNKHIKLAGNEKLLAEIVWPHFWAIQIMLFVLIASYCTMHELVRVMGKEKVRRIFFGPMPSPKV